MRSSIVWREKVQVSAVPSRAGGREWRGMVVVVVVVVGLGLEEWGLAMQMLASGEIRKHGLVMHD